MNWVLQEIGGKKAGLDLEAQNNARKGEKNGAKGGLLEISIRHRCNKDAWCVGWIYLFILTLACVTPLCEKGEIPHSESCVYRCQPNLQGKKITVVRGLGGGKTAGQACI